MNEPSENRTPATTAWQRWLRRLFINQRLIALATIGLVLIGLVLFYQRYYLARPIGEGPAGPPVDAALFSKIWTDRPVLLLGIGDSVTAGLGARKPSHSYFNRILTNPEDEFPELRGICLSAVLPNLSHQNLAISGTTSDAHLSVVQERLTPSAEEQFGLVVLTTGGNDLIHSYGRAAPRESAMYGATLSQAEPWIAAFEKRLETMLSTIENAFPGGCEIYLADIYDPTDGVGDGASLGLADWPDGLAIHARYNAAIHACAHRRTNVHIVPLHATFLGHGSHCRQFWRSTYRQDDPNYWFYQNVEDPNDRGYDAIRRVFLNAIAQNTKLRQL